MNISIEGGEGEMMGQLFEELIITVLLNHLFICFINSKPK